jgi:hypothetical protein
MERMKLVVNIDHWIISDGNYEDFHAGEIRQFALEFYAPMPLDKVSVAEKKLQLSDDYKYHITAEVTFASEGICVIDFGLLAYSQTADNRGGFATGDFVEGDIFLGVDPFFYFDDLSRIEAVPALIYAWKIDSIQQDTTPFILLENSERTIYGADISRQSRAEVLGTDEDIVDDPLPFSTSYFLHCIKLDVSPSKVLKGSQWAENT